MIRKAFHRATLVAPADSRPKALEWTDNVRGHRDRRDASDQGRVQGSGTGGPEK
jgi:hypothetical protein